MASDFIGSTVLVTLHHPPGACVQGVVRDIYNAQLYLTSGHQTPSFLVASNNIADLEVIPDAAPQAFVPTASRHGQSSPNQTPTATHFNQKAIPTPQLDVDPAILSVSRRPPAASQPPDYHKDSPLAPLFNASNHENSHPRKETAELGTNGEIEVAPRAARKPLREKARGLVANAQHTTTEPYTDDHSTLEAAAPRQRLKKSKAPAASAHAGTEYQAPSAKQLRAQARRQRAKAEEAQNGWATEDATDIQEMGDFDFEASLSKFDKREVFRQLREDDHVTPAERLVGHNRLPAKPGTAGGRNLHWTENVLESSPPRANKLAAATNGIWNSEAGESENEDGFSDRAVGGSKTSSRNVSRTGSGAVPVRKGSGRAQRLSSDSRLPLQARHSSHDGRTSAASQRLTNNIDPSAASPLQRARNSLSASSFGGSSGSVRSSLRLATTGKLCPSITSLQTFELEQASINDMGLTEDLLQENAGHGIAEAVVQTLAGDLDKELDSHKRMPAIPKGTHIVILTANHRTGARALVAGRHLRNRGVRVTACVLGLEPGEEDVLASIRQQAQAFRHAGGATLRPTELTHQLRTRTLTPALILDALLGVHLALEDLRLAEQAWCMELFAMIPSLEPPATTTPTPIVAGPTTSVSNASGAGMTYAAKAAAAAAGGTSSGSHATNTMHPQTIWSRVHVLAVDVPSGTDSSSGTITRLDTQPVTLDPSAVVSLVAPKPWLMTVLRDGQRFRDPSSVMGHTHPETVPARPSGIMDPHMDGESDRPPFPRLLVADIGIGNAAWKRLGNRRSRGVEFGSAWVVPLVFQVPGIEA